MMKSRLHYLNLKKTTATLLQDQVTTPFETGSVLDTHDDLESLIQLGTLCNTYIRLPMHTL